MMNTFMELSPWILSPLLLAASLAVGYTVHGLVFKILSRLAQRTALNIDDSFVEQARRPARLMIVLIAFRLSLYFLPPDGDALAILAHAITLAWIAAAAWLLVNMTNVLETALLNRYGLHNKDNLKARKIVTQFKVFQRIIIVLTAILALALMLMTFDEVRKLGISLLASAGVAGIVIGFSAQNTVSNIFAGIQIALAQPIRIDDVVIVEGEWGRIEEITFTYVVVAIWDQRRLIVPIRYFLENPVQNWTRSGSEIMGTVEVHADYTLPVDSVRQELERICKEEAGDIWDGRVCVLQVTEAGERTITLRALVSSRDASLNWDLCCLVREKLVAYISKEHPSCLPLERQAERQPKEDA